MNMRNAWHFAIAIILVNAVVACGAYWVAANSSFGDDMPPWFRVGFIAFIYVVTCWFLIAHRPQDRRGTTNRDDRS